MNCDKVQDLRNKWAAATMEAARQRGIAEGAFMLAQQHESAAQSYLERLMNEIG